MHTQYSTVQYSTVQYSTVQYSTVQYSAVQYSTVQYSTVQCSAVQCSAVQCSAVQCSAVQCSTLQYSTVPAVRAHRALLPYSAVQYQQCVHAAHYYRCTERKERAAWEEWSVVGGQHHHLLLVRPAFHLDRFDSPLKRSPLTPVLIARRFTSTEGEGRPGMEG
jgi:hypothetical protein